MNWHPVACAADLPQGHVYQTRLDGQGLALWRAADGSVNVWEDRCPHRGVRFSVGNAMGTELRCQYHNWRFASGSGACTMIPAHPDRKPAAAIRATIFPVHEMAGLVWTSLDGEGGPEPVADGIVLRPIPVDRPAAMVRHALADAAIPEVRFFVQSIEAGRCVIRGITSGAGDELAMLRSMDAVLERLRRRLEAA